MCDEAASAVDGGRLLMELLIFHGRVGVHLPFRAAAECIPAKDCLRHNYFMTVSS